MTPIRSSENSQLNRTWGSYLYCLICAVVLITICSQSSFLYPLNDWVDSNIYFTMGKAMMEGKVLYRDVFDHKGPLIYFVHGLASLLSRKSFLGVYLIEIVAAAFTCIGAYKTLLLYTARRSEWLIPIFGAIIYVSNSFCHGDSAEELCMPFLIWSLYYFLKYFKEQYPAPMKNQTLFWNGLFAGCILWVKYTMLGFHFAWMMLIFISCLLRKDFKRSIGSCFVFLGGMTMATIPWILYFGWHHALSSLWHCYIYDNIFLYGNSSTVSLFAMIKSMVKNFLDGMIGNTGLAVLLILGFGWYIASKNHSLLEKVNLIVLFVFTTLGICYGVVQWQPYYAFVWNLFGVIGCIGVAEMTDGIPWKREVKKRIKGKREMTEEQSLADVKRHAGVRILYLSLILLLTGGYAYQNGNYTDQIGRAKETLVQYQFAEIIQQTDNPTLLNYGFLDGGFYTAADIVPENRFFCATNIVMPERYEEQHNMILKGETDFVVTRGFELDEEEGLKYNLISKKSAVYEGISYDYYLYQREDKTENR